MAADTNECPTPINGPLKGEAGNNQDTPFHSLAIDPTNPSVAYVGTEGDGIFKTSDGGVNWTRLRTGLKCTIAHTFYSQIFDIAIDPNNTQTLYASAINGPGPSSPATYPSASGGVYKSTDGGATWTQKNQGLASTYVTYVLVDAKTPGRVYAVVGGLTATYPTYPGAFVNGGVYVSNDAAETWAPLTLPSGVESNIFIDAVLRGGDQRTLYLSGQVHKGEAPTAYGFIRSADGGATWSISNPAGETVSGFDAFKGDPSIIYANVASGHRAYKSVDGGATWAAVGPQIFYGVTRIHPTISQTAYFTAAGIWKTTDGFATVQQVYNDTTLANDQSITDIKIAPSNGNVIWAAAKGYYLYRSVDGGASWTKFTGVRDLVYGKNSVDLGNAPVTSIAPVRFSAPGPVNSFLRVYNPNGVEGQLQIDVRDDLGTVLGTFNKVIAANTAPQFIMKTIEQEAGVIVPTRTGAFAQLDVKANFNGFAQHVTYDSSQNVILNLSSCSHAGASAAGVSGKTAMNVHSSVLGFLPSVIVLANGDSASGTVNVDVRDAGTGILIGRWPSPAIPGHGAVTVAISKIQSELGFTPTDAQYHLILTISDASLITLGHYNDNPSGIKADMGTRCEFRAVP